MTRTTSKYIPPPQRTGWLDTPKKGEDYGELCRRLEADLTPSRKVILRKLEKGITQELTANRILQIELKEVRQQELDTEIEKRNKRIEKEEGQRT